MKGHQLRLYAIGFFFLFILLLLIWRMYDLTIRHHQFLQGQGDARSLRTINIPAYRGMITDRLGAPLAVSTPVKSIWVNPKLFDPTPKQLRLLLARLHMSASQLLSLLDKGKDREFIYVKRQLNPFEADKIEALKIPGLNFQEEFKRYYPQGECTAQLLGFTNVDDNGIEGLELAYQRWLMGISGKKRVLKDRLGRVIEELGIIHPPRPGNDLHLSIDRRIQYFAYQELENTINKFSAASGSVVVIDTQNGEVLAMANYPSFNPNVRNHFTLDRYRNRAVTDTFEPGSVMKPFSIASALQTGQYTPDTVIDTRPNRMMVHGHVIRDIHNYGVLTVTGVLQRSSNIGVSKMILSSPPEQLIGLLTRAGIGQRTESGYPGESEGSLVKVKEANPFVLATLGFGYGMSVTALQLAKSYLIFANEGNLIPITLLHYSRAIEKTNVLDKKTANKLLLMMEAVVNGDTGTGKQAKIAGYRIAGKTGTARIAGKQGYEAHRHIGSFVGIAPVSNPRLIVAVVIHEPTKLGYYGGAIAAPLFSKVMELSLRILNIQPDEASRQHEA